MNEEKKEENKKEETTVVLEQKDAEPVTLDKINELLTNNLKWSQIIYEQNRKINRKLFWYSFFNYLKFALIIIPLVIGLFYVLPSINSLFQTFDIFSGDSMNQKSSTEQNILIENFLEQMPLDQLKKEQIRALLH